ncbi:uncharacterized protein LOC141760669 [Sebastes fasciatus]|uniref:uncharacterized protein LOC141760669 n=1 Tax=Sebastes fasciatus TaxID=394691 RepID=UPI003D9EBF05
MVPGSVQSGWFLPLSGFSSQSLTVFQELRVFFRMQLFIAPLLLFFVLSSHVATVTAWAGCQRGRDKDDRTRENCTALGFSDVPRGFETSTKVMLFPNNLFSSLSWSSFQIFINIYELDLTGNKIPEVTSSVTPILPTLCVLRLGWNRLTSLSDGSFSACPALTELYLDNNALDSLSDRTFSGLSKLEILDLSSNRIKVLPKLMLHPLPAIETLYLENNTIEVMPDDWFSQKEEVPYLFLSANPWECSCSIFYFRRYLDEFDFNVYVRNGPIIKTGVEKVVCDSPPFHQGKPLIELEEDDLCSTEEEYDPIGPLLLFLFLPLFLLLLLLLLFLFLPLFLLLLLLLLLLFLPLFLLLLLLLLLLFLPLFLLLLLLLLLLFLLLPLQLLHQRS